MTPALARIAVLVSGAAVLVVETLAARLVAPYVGLTLESHSAAIGVALLGIALGAHLGGVLADRIEPSRVVVTGLFVGGTTILAVRPLVHAFGPGVTPGAASTVVLIALTTLVPVTALSAVPVGVVRARLSDVERSGRVVGSLSALGTIGALAGTFLTGFVFVATMPTRAILTATGAVVIAVAVVVAGASRLRRAGPHGLTLVVAAGFLVAVDGPCDVETAYYCARIEADAARPSGRTLWLDDLAHAYVDLDDPRHLEFDYTHRFAAAIDTRAPVPRALDVIHVGGGGFTMPRYLAATRPGTRSTVLEIDRAVVALGRARLGVASISSMHVTVGDARTSLRRLPGRSADVVIGDAFGGRSVPWHLATREFVLDVARVLRDDGTYVLNVIDHAPNAFLRAEVATIAAVFPHVVVLADPGQFPRRGGNFVVVASRAPIDGHAIAARASSRSPVVALDARSVGARARILTDGFAPVDQLLTPYP